MQGVGAARKLGVTAIHRQSVLRQIVAADRQKIDLPDETGRHERGGGSFYHRTQFDSIGDADLGLELVDDAAHGKYFRGVGDHRDEQPHVARRPHPQRCAQLGAHEIRVRERGADAAQPEGRIVLRGQRQVAERLVAAHVHQPQDQGSWPKRRGNVLICRELFSLRGRRLPIDEQEFGAQQPAALGAMGDGRRRIRHIA